MSRTIAALAVLAVIAAARRTHAEPLSMPTEQAPTRVLVVRTGEEPSCVDPAAVAAAIARHGALPAQVVVPPVKHVPGVIELVMHGDPAHFEIELRGGVQDMSRVFDDTPCAAIPDAVAAFVAAALVPLPAITPGQALSARELTDAVQALLGDALGPNLRVLVSETEGSWAATLLSGSCTQRAMIGPLPEDRDAAARRAADAVVSMLTEHDACRSSQASIRTERVLLLSDALQPDTSGAYNAVQAVTGGVGVLAVGTALWLEGTDLGRGLMIAGGTTMLASSITAIAMPRSSTASALSTAGSMLGVGTLCVGFAFFDPPDPREPRTERDTFQGTPAIVGAGYIASALWIGIDQFAEPWDPPATLFDLRARLRTPSQRASVTEAQLAEYEQTFRRARLRKRYLVPPLVASLAAIAYAANLDDPDEQAFGLMLSVTQLALFGVAALVPDPVARYTRRLRDAGLSMQVTPAHGGAGLAVGGRF